MRLLEVKSVKKVYTSRFGGNKVIALNNVNFSVDHGEYVAIMGESGAGKTTLLNLLATLDKASEGQILLNGKDLSQMNEKEAANFRRKHLGFVFQDFNLLDTFSLRDNIYLPLVLSGKNHKECFFPSTEKRKSEAIPISCATVKRTSFLLAMLLLY